MWLGKDKVHKSLVWGIEQVWKAGRGKTGSHLFLEKILKQSQAVGRDYTEQKIGLTLALSRIYKPSKQNGSYIYLFKKK